MFKKTTRFWGRTMTDETGFIHLRRIYHAIEQAALSSPWAHDPYVIRRREKGESKDNAIPTRRAMRILNWVDPLLHLIAYALERKSDGIFSTERRCGKCGIMYDPLPEDEGICLLCILNL